MLLTNRFIVLTSSAVVTAATALGGGAVLAGDCGGYAGKSACPASCGAKTTLAASDGCGEAAPAAAGVQLASMRTETPDIVDTAVSAGSFNTLVAAVKAAGLVDTLKGEGPFTVFAPSDDAFAKLPAGTIENLLKPENKATLQAILTYHVVPGELTASTVKRLGGATTANGQKVDLSVKNGSVMVDGAKVVKADIMTGNGVIHVIDRVILPASDNIVQTAGSAGTFSTLLTAAQEAGLADVLADGGPFTVFAPSDEAFAKLPAGTVESLLEPANRDKLAAILKYHVVSGRAYAADAVKAGSVRTLQGGNVVFSVRNGSLYVDNAKIVATDIDASNGVIHVIDSVILPE